MRESQEATSAHSESREQDVEEIKIDDSISPFDTYQNPNNMSDD